jgi:Na+-transporting NADH:ubiquinone oxidoreductase subunit C
MYTNGYIFRYAGIMVILAAAMLSTAAMLLKPFQERNMAIEKMGDIMASAEITDITTDETISKFNEVVVEALVVDQDGNVANSYTEASMQNSEAFSLDMKKELYKKSKGEDYKLPIYIIEKDSKKTYIFPMMGVGLWGPVWGNLALSSDLNTIVGVTFGHKGETPGLGAEITTKAFTDQFIGKEIFNTDGKFTSILVVKGGAATLPQNMQNHAVDAISGGTITSNGVGDMINNVMLSYLPYIEKQK